MAERVRTDLPDTAAHVASIVGLDQSPSSTSLRYEPVPNWGLLPHGVTFNGDATSVAVDSNDRVYVFNRGPSPIVVFEPDGTFVHAFGEGEYDNAHGLAIDGRDSLYLVDRNNFVQRRDRDGKVDLTIGERGVAGRPYSGEGFNNPTDVAISARTGELFVSDGYGNAHVHHYRPDGELVRTWGGIGDGVGQFSLPHGIEFLDDERLIVCDRENHRLQVFSLDGTFLEQWHSHRPSGVRRSSANGFLYVAEAGPGVRGRAHLPNLGHRIAIYSTSGERLGQFGNPFPGYGPDQFLSPHAVAVDSNASVYIAEVNRTLSVEVLGEEPPRGERPSLRKWRLAGSAG
jgi:hypothetical protein